MKYTINLYASYAPGYGPVIEKTIIEDDLVSAADRFSDICKNLDEICEFHSYLYSPDRYLYSGASGIIMDYYFTNGEEVRRLQQGHIFEYGYRIGQMTMWWRIEEAGEDYSKIDWKKWNSAGVIID